MNSIFLCMQYFYLNPKPHKNSLVESALLPNPKSRTHQNPFQDSSSKQQQWLPNIVLIVHVDDVEMNYWRWRIPNWNNFGGSVMIGGTNSTGGATPSPQPSPSPSYPLGALVCLILVARQPLVVSVSCRGQFIFILRGWQRVCWVKMIWFRG